jgi:hypothetical protein
MRDVAALAGVGQKTVSRVVNNEPNVRPEMRERVLRATRQLGFRPNAAASSIRRLDQRTRTVGVVGDDIGHPFASSLIRALEKYARTRGHQFLLTASSERDPVREQELVAELAARRVDGLVVMPTGQDESYLERERQLGIPVVFIDRPGRRWQSDAVLSAQDGPRSSTWRPTGTSASPTSATLRASTRPRTAWRATGSGCGRRAPRSCPTTSSSSSRRRRMPTAPRTGSSTAPSRRRRSSPGTTS